MQARELLGEILLRQGLADEPYECLAPNYGSHRDPHTQLLAIVAAARAHKTRLAKIAMRTYLVLNGGELGSKLCQESELPGTREFRDIEATGLLLLGAEDTNSPDEALSWLKASDTLAPNNSVTSFLMGRAYAAKKDWASARRLLSEAAKGSGKSAALARDSLREIPG
jgi:hypothetical protein